MKVNDVKIHHHYIDPKTKIKGSYLIKSDSLRAKNIIDKIKSMRDQWTNRSFIGEKTEAKVDEEKFKSLLLEG